MRQKPEKLKNGVDFREAGPRFFRNLILKFEWEKPQNGAFLQNRTLISL